MRILARTTAAALVLFCSCLTAFSFQDFSDVSQSITISEVHGITDERSGSTTVELNDQIEFILNNPDTVNLNKYSLFLYIDGQRLPTNKPLSVESDRVVFTLHETDTLKSLLMEYVNSWGVHTRAVRMSLGDANGSHIHIEIPNITIDFDPYYSVRSWIGRIIIVLVIMCFFLLAKKNFFLKAVDSDKYSLSRTQMGWWTLIVICSYIALWSDSTGVSIQRFQSVVFTFFIGVFFVYKVIVDFEMPDLDPGILGLMGISSATYAGLKTNEEISGRKTPEPPTPEAAPNPPAEGS